MSLFSADGVFHRLAETEFNGRLGGDLDHLTGGRVAAFAGFAGRLYELPESRKGEFAVLLNLFDRECRDGVKETFHFDVAVILKMPETSALSVKKL